MDNTVYYPLTHAQKRIWYTETFYPGTSVSNLSGFGKLKSESGIDPGLLTEAIRQFVRTNETMRFRLKLAEGGEPKQYIAEYEPFDIEYIDAEEYGGVDEVLRWGQAEAQRPIPLYESRLFTFAVVRISPEESWFFTKVHHAIADGISMTLLGNRITDIYLKLEKGEQDFEAVQASFTEHIQSELEYERSKRFEKDRAYWNAQYESIPEPVSLKQSDSYQIRLEAVRLSKEISPSLHKKIQTYCKENNISVLSLFLSILHIYMHRVTGQNDIVLGTFMGNRTNAKEKQMLGMFVSTIPMKAHIDAHQDFTAFVQERMKEQLKVIRHQKYPYNLLINDLREREPNINRLFAVSLEYQVMQWQQKETVSFLTEPIFSGSEMNDISIHVKERWDTGTLAIDFDYRSELFSSREMSALYERLMTLLEDALTSPHKRINDLAVVSNEEKEMLLQRSSASLLKNEKEMTLHGLFEQKAAEIPDKTAVFYEGKHLSYRELNEQANRLAKALRKRGIGPDKPAAVLMERSEQTLTAILGILKAGGAYVPIDPGFPEERIHFMLKDSNAKVVIADGEFHAETAETLLFAEAVAETEEAGNLPSSAGAEHLAYIIYTSGTTGRPKGVMIEHRQVHHLVRGLQQAVDTLKEDDLKLALLAPFHFDASVQQIFLSLILGKSLYIVPKKTVSDGRALAAYYRRHHIDITDCTPSHLQLLLAADDLHGIKLKHILTGGEALSWNTVDKLLQLFSKTADSRPLITNVYGPTETCVDASAFTIPNDGHVRYNTAYVPIGKPIGNNRFYILDENGALLPDGAEGELYIAGAGVGRGYLKLPELTAERFSADPFVPGGIMYRTGDAVKWLPDGTVEFVGRKDDQVKIRGYRIELGEIESVLQGMEHIEQAVVLARPSAGGDELCGYVVPKKGGAVSAPALREHLSKHLPDYMLPSYFVELHDMPLTPSGKVDRKALLRHEVTVSGVTEYTAPRNDREQKIADIWRDVLGAGQVGIHDQFFELGGHSLKAMTMLAKIHKAFSVEVPLNVLFAKPTVAGLSEYIAEAERKGFAEIKPAAESEHYPLSLAQQRIYIVSELEDAGIGYNMPAAAMLEGTLDLHRLEEAFQKLVDRHEALRTSFLSVNGEPRQKIHQQVRFKLEMIEGGSMDEERMLTSFVRRFDLEKAPLMRVGLVRIEDTRHMLLFDMHHLISDGVSISIILHDLAKFYNGEQLPDVRLHYKDYASWQRDEAEGGFQKEEEYWKNVFSGELPVLQLLTDEPRPAVQSFEGDRVSAVLPKAVKDKLNGLAEKNGATLYMVMLAAYNALLAKYTGQDDVIVGTPTAGRRHSDLEGIVGMFVNTLAIRSKVDRQHTFTELLDDVRQTVLDAFEHQDYPFEWLAEKLNVPRDLSRHPIFDTMFILQNAMDDIPLIGDLRLSIHETNVKIAKFDLTLQAKEEREGIVIDLDYSTKLFRKGTAERMLKHYLHLLREITADPSRKIGEYGLLTEEETNRQLVEFNPGASDYPIEKTIIQQFEEQAEKAEDRPALQFEGTVFTYGELNERANQLARHLRDNGVENGTTAAVLTARSAEMVVGILAVLKAGAAYVPIDPDHPEQRIKHFFHDSGASVLLTQKALKPLAEAAEFTGGTIILDDEHLYRGDARNLNVPVSPEALANLTYTSGTTGMPKGNMVTHRNILRTVKNTNYMEIMGTDIVLSISNYVFDAFMFDVFGSLLNGAKLVIVSKETILDMERLAGAIEKENVTVLMITTALFNLLTDMRPGCMKNLRRVLFGGERASVDHVKRALKAAGKGKLLHMYGPSESTVFTTYHPVNDVPENAQTVPIGKPVSNTEVLILDPFGNIQPRGVAGELCVGGDGLVRGYFNRPDLTAEKFVPHPFKKGQKIYRTGDLARWLSDGSIEFIGRIDHQVKIRGQRIELGEIEHHLLSHDAIQEAAVLAVNGTAGDKMICAYIVADRELSNRELRQHAAVGLPGYMIPSVFMQLEELPLTGNGKVDRRALPEPDAAQIAQTEYTAPRNRAEAQLAGLWQEVLNVPKVGVHDNFFELGGHSLLGMALIARIQQEMNVELRLKDLFQSPTVESLAKTAEQAGKTSSVRIDPAKEQEAYPVSSAQKRIYVLQQLEGAEKSYNMPSVLRLEGKLDLKRLEEAARMLVMRHEAFRTSFHIEDGEPVQRIRKDTGFTVDVINAEEREAEKLIKEFIRPFDLAEAPLFRMNLIRLAEEKHLLFVDMHHIISDGASVSVLIDELTRLYAGETLEPLRIQYKDYTVWQRAFLQTGRDKKLEEYWLRELGGELPVLALPTDYPRPSVQTFEGDRIAFTINQKLVRALRKLAQETGTTLYMVLLASYSAFLSKLSGQKDIVVGSPAAGRSHGDLDKIIGMFVNTLAMRTHPQGEKTFAAFLKEVKETSLGAYEHQDYPFEELVEKLEVRRDMSRNPLFDAVFAMQNADLRALSMEGVTLRPYEFEHKTAKFDLTLAAAEEDDIVRFEMEYNTALFKDETISRWSKYWLNLLEAVADNPNIRLSELSLLDEAEKRRIVEAWNDTALDVPSDKTIHELFEAQVSRTPDHGAAVFNGRRWTYRELNARANRLARLLIEKGARPEQRIGIMVKPSLEMAAGVLSILKAGAAYVPIDPAYPEQRVKYILEDSGAELLLTQTGTAVPDGFCGETILLDAVLAGEVTSEDEVNPQSEAKPDNLAYLIYTSGTTGRPKGVMVEHHSLVNLCYWHNDEFVVTERDKSAKYAGFGFDASVWEMFPYWIAGSELHMIDEAIRMDIVRLNQYFEEHGITITFLPTQLCEQFMELDNKSLRVLLTGGDKLKRVEKRGYTLVNNYGPTENTVVATSTAIDPDEGMLSIGRPIANTRVYVLGEHNEVQPAGVTGELCIAGRGLARGYLNKPEETEKRFTADPFVPGERMYRTGDAVKWLPDGRVEYIGRIDQQVKIRGFRIELSEIEVQLAKLPGVQEAAVTDIEDAHGNKALCGYVTSAEPLDTGRLADQLAKTLPDYMVPAYWVQLSELPITANGKVDKRALPQPDLTVQTAEYKAPRSETEQLLADVWQEVLGVERIGISDNFFTLGGDSIKGIQMASRLQQHGLKLEMKDLFQHPTIEQISFYVETADDKAIDQGPVEGEVMLTPIQRWFFERAFTNEHHWNQSVMLHAPSGFDPEITGQVLSGLMAHHDALRIIYKRDGENVVQYNRGLEAAEVQPEVIHLHQSGAELEASILEEANRIQSSIDLSQGHLLKAAIFKTGQGDHLLIVIHHLVVDGVSWRILLEDFAAGLLQAEKGEPIVLPEKSHSFAEYAARLSEYAGSKTFAKEIGYWEEIEKTAAVPLPKDAEADDKRMRHTKTVEFSLTKEETEQLMTKVHEAYNTEMNDILLTALGFAVKEWTGQSDFIVTLEGHGREDIIDGLNMSRTVGWFTSQFPALIQMRHSDDMGYQIKQVKEDLRHIPHKGIGYGIYRYLTEEGKKSGRVKPEISFNYLGQFTEMSESGRFTRSKLPSGDPLSPDTEKPNALDIVGFIEDGVLTMSIAYHSLEFKESTISTVAGSFKAYLLQLIDHCLTQDGDELTPSDLGDDDLTLEELDKLMEIF